MRSRLLVALFGLLLASPNYARDDSLDAPNVVQISASLVTAGQPSRSALADLSRLGFQAVIYLAPSNVSDAIPDERELLLAQGIEFVHIPVPFNAPTELHYLLLTAALERLSNRRVLVHCQINQRASTLVFLYRAIMRREDPNVAFGAVSRIWAPEGPWKKLITALLREHNVQFELM